jgi:preprotein translocase subunit YajC
MHYSAFLLLQSAPAQPSPLLQFAPFVFIIAIFYFLVFRPMQRQKKQQQEMLRNLKNGDQVVTSGGLIGTIQSLSAETVVLRVKPDNVKLQFSRSAISGLVQEGTPTP